MPTASGTSIEAAASAVQHGAIIAYPTEGVFGLGCDPRNQQTLAKLLAIKQRDQSKGLILIAATYAQLEGFIAAPASHIKTKLDESWPGPVTWILPAADNVPSLLTGGRTTIAARVSSHPPVMELCMACNSALVSTSANLSGEKPLLNASQVMHHFNGQVDYILDQPLGNLDGPTPIFDGTTGKQIR